MPKCRAQIGGTRWYKVGTRQETCGPMFWAIFSLPELPSGSLRMAQNSLKMPSIGHMRPYGISGSGGSKINHFWTPGAIDGCMEMAFMAPSHVVPYIWVWYGTLEAFQVGFPTLEAACPIYGILRLYWAILGQPKPPEVVPAVKKCGQIVPPS